MLIYYDDKLINHAFYKQYIINTDIIVVFVLSTNLMSQDLFNRLLPLCSYVVLLKVRGDAHTVLTMLDN